MKQPFNVYQAIEKLNRQFDNSKGAIPRIVGVAIVDVRKPFAYASFHNEPGSRHGWIYAVGFSKCNPTDKYDADFGIKLAFNRAVKDYVRQAKERAQ